MDTLFTQNVVDETEDIPQTDNPVWILGRKYNAIKELDAIRRDIRSKLWFTYRKGFVPIGGSSSTFTSDKGWGCMLRCGQMVLAQALITLHLGKDWQWMPESRNSTYLKILKRFEDKRAAAFSIHQIALMGASEGKEVGQWFGPNTIAQVLKKLVVYDEWSSLTIHVALDNTLIINDVLRQCKIEGGVTAEIDEEMPLKAPSQWKPLLLLIPLRLGLSEINPVYVNGLKCFFCATEMEFRSLCKSMQEELTSSKKQPLFELCTERLAHWSPAENAASTAITSTNFADFEQIERQYDTSDEDFELLG